MFLTKNLSWEPPAAAYFMNLQIERNPFPASYQILTCFRVYISRNRWASSTLIQVESYRFKAFEGWWSVYWILAIRLYSGVGGVGAGVQVPPPQFWFVKNPGKIPENPGKNVAQHFLISKNSAQRLLKNTRRPFSWRSYQKRCLWEKICR